MKVIIPVAGAGTRLRPQTHTKPKQLLPVAGKPVIDHIMDKVVPLKPSEIIFITGHLRHQLEQHLRTTYPQVKMRFIEQTELNGTAAAINLARDAFNEDLLIDFGDTIFDTDLSVIRKNQDDAILWAMHREDYQRFGVIVTDANGHATSIVEKPKEPISKLANIGLYYIKNTKLLGEGIDHTLKNKKPGKEAYLTDAFEYMIHHGAKLKAMPCTSWFDAGTPAALLETNQILLEKVPQRPLHYNNVVIIPPVAIHKSAQLEHSTIGPFVSIGAKAVITNSVIRNSILDEGSVVQDSMLTDSIIGVEAVVIGNASKLIIGDHSRVEGLSVTAARHQIATTPSQKVKPIAPAKKKKLSNPLL